LVVGSEAQHDDGLMLARSLYPHRCLPLVLVGHDRPRVFEDQPFVYAGTLRRHDLPALLAKAVRDDLFNRFWQQRKRHLEQCLGRLTARERHMLQLLLTGHSVKDIALVLCISHKTAHNHRHSILKKTGFENFIQMLFAATAAGLVDPVSYGTSAVRLRDMVHARQRSVVDRS
jgi:DNA-binding CsgD family transcriptional regulator